MTEAGLRRLIEAVRTGRVTRRDFIGTLAGLGLTAPLAVRLLTASGVAHAQASFDYKPSRRGGGGALRLLWWQAPTLLNPHFATGAKDVDASRIFYEPLGGYDLDGNLVPVLAAEIPTLENGGLSRDGRTAIWKLKRDVQWHDGKPFTSADVVFNWEYVIDPATAAVSIGQYKDAKVSAIDPFTVRIDFEAPTPAWDLPFCGGGGGQIIPRHIFEPYKGAKSREAPNNLKPIGTGPYKFADFAPGDMVRGVINPNYHQPNRPHFDSIEMKGGGDAVSAARAVLQSGEYDYEWNLQVEDEVLTRLESGGKGKADAIPCGDVEFILVNFCDPWTEVEGERSHVKTTHPSLSDPAVRDALHLLIDRPSVHQFIYGRTGLPTSNILAAPERFRSKSTTIEYNADKASQLLDKAGWTKGADGIRAKNGRKLKIVFQTSVNQPRQKTQAVIKQACQKAGIDVELKTVTPSVYFSSDFANPDTASKFYADIQMYSQQRARPDPQLYMRQFCSWEAASKANKWQGRNVMRWRNDEYDRTFRAAETELDPVKRAVMLIRLNDLVVGERAVIPVVTRPRIRAAANRLKARLTAWDSDLWAIQDWYRE